MNWPQLQTILWLRWRLTRNQWNRGSALNGVIMLIVMAVGVGLSAAGGVAGLLGGALALPKAPPLALLFVWDGLVAAFLFFWIISLLSEIQRSESIDLGRLLHLPVSLRQVFLLNYAASHLTLSLILFVPAMVGLALGLSWGISWRMILVLPLVLSFLFAVTAWTYCLRGWLVALMVNQRRRRTVIMAVTMAIVLVAQLPNLYFNLLPRTHHPRLPRIVEQTAAESDVPGLSPQLVTAHRVVPPLWIGYGALALQRGHILPAFLAFLASFAMGSIGLMRAYRSTLRFYRGEAKATAASRPLPQPAAESSRGTFMETALPWLPQEAAALALALFRSMTRAPEVKMALGSNFLAVLVMGIVFLTRESVRTGATAQLFIATAVVALPFLGMIQLMFNQFGLDRDGFRALVLLPVPRHQVLLAKNLSFLPLALGIALVLLGFAAVLAHLSVLLIPTAIFQLLTLFFFVSTVGNIVSIYAPYRVAPGSLKPTKAPGRKMLLIFLWQLIFPLAMVPAILPPALGALSNRFHFLPGTWVDLGCSVLLAALAAAIYALTLKSLGRLLRRREIKVLEAVTQEVE